jgi:hypothetical protein
MPEKSLKILSQQPRSCTDKLHPQGSLPACQVGVIHAGTFQRRRRTLGDIHPHTLESWHNLIDLYEVGTSRAVAGKAAS